MTACQGDTGVVSSASMSEAEQEYTVLKDHGLRGARMLIFDSLPSTNTWALKNVSRLRHGDVVTALRQTAGKGRFDREWIQADDRGLSVTAVLAEIGSDEVLGNIGRAAAVAVRECLINYTIPSKLKWPNDVIVGAKKISGILAERDSKSGAVFLGIGLNVNTSAVDLASAGLADTATSMAVARGKPFDVAEVRTRLVRELDTLLARLLKEGAGAVEFTWREFDYLDGCQIEFDAPSGPVKGAYMGVDRTGRLLLADESGREHIFSSGEVRKLSIRS